MSGVTLPMSGRILPIGEFQLELTPLSSKCVPTERIECKHSPITRRHAWHEATRNAMRMKKSGEEKTIEWERPERTLSQLKHNSPPAANGLPRGLSLSPHKPLGTSLACKSITSKILKPVSFRFSFRPHHIRRAVESLPNLIFSHGDVHGRDSIH